MSWRQTVDNVQRLTRERLMDNTLSILSEGLNTLGGEFRTNGQTAHEYVRSVLRSAILNGELAGGTRLVQAELAAVLEVSTTPVREALRDVATEGLIDFDPHRGAVVHELSGTELHEIYEIRMLLEPLAMRQAVPRITEPLLAQLRRLHKKMLDEPHSAEWVDYNRIFHMAIIENAAAPRLAAIIRGLQDASVMYIGASLQNVAGLRHNANRDNAAILDALERKDIKAAIEASSHHLAVSIRAFDQSAQPTTGSQVSVTPRQEPARRLR